MSFLHKPCWNRRSRQARRTRVSSLTYKSTQILCQPLEDQECFQIPPRATNPLEPSAGCLHSSVTSLDFGLPYLSGRGTQAPRKIHPFQAPPAVLSVQEILEIQGVLVVQGSPSVLENLFHLVQKSLVNVKRCYLQNKKSRPSVPFTPGIPGFPSLVPGPGSPGDPLRPGEPGVPGSPGVPFIPAGPGKPASPLSPFRPG